MDRDLAHLQDILDSAEYAVNYLGDRTYEQFRNDTLIQDAIVRRFAIIGEAAKRLLKSPNQADWEELSLIDMVDTRNFLVHEYEAIDYYEVFEAIRDDLPNIISIVRERILDIENKK